MREKPFLIGLTMAMLPMASLAAPIEIPKLSQGADAAAMSAHLDLAAALPAAETKANPLGGQAADPGAVAAVQLSAEARVSEDMAARAAAVAELGARPTSGADGEAASASSQFRALQGDKRDEPGGDAVKDPELPRRLRSYLAPASSGGGAPMGSGEGLSQREKAGIILGSRLLGDQPGFNGPIGSLWGLAVARRLDRQPSRPRTRHEDDLLLLAGGAAFIFAALGVFLLNAF